MPGPLSAGAQNLIRFLERERIPSSKLAAAIGVSPPMLSDYERGRKRPKHAVAAKIERFTRGEVRISDWMLPEELKEIEQVDPFRRTGTHD